VRADATPEAKVNADMVGGKILNRSQKGPIDSQEAFPPARSSSIAAVCTLVGGACAAAIRGCMRLKRMGGENAITSHSDHMLLPEGELKPQGTPNIIHPQRTGLKSKNVGVDSVHTQPTEPPPWSCDR
jgi:hypothetical protein